MRRSPRIVNKNKSYRTNNKPNDYILEILPQNSTSQLINRVPVAKKAPSVRRSRSLPRKTSNHKKLNRRVSSLPNLNNINLKNKRRNNNLPPLPFQEETPVVPVRTERIKRLVELKKKMREQKEKTNKLLPI